MNPFLIRFNAEFNYLHLPEFIFANAFYLSVISKEVRNIVEIFQTYNIKLTSLSDECMEYSQPITLSNQMKKDANEIQII